MSERRACTAIEQHRSTQRYTPKQRPDELLLVAAIHQLVKKHPRRGCRYITTCLRREGWRVNRKRVHRLWKREGFKVPRKHHKKRAVGDSGNACDKRVATSRNDVWTWDFIHDRTVDGRQLKCLVILDEFTRECLCLDVARSMTADDVLGVLSECMARHGVPRHIRSDNGSEFSKRPVNPIFRLPRDSVIMKGSREEVYDGGYWREVLQAEPCVEPEAVAWPRGGPSLQWADD